VLVILYGPGTCFANNSLPFSQAIRQKVLGVLDGFICLQGWVTEFAAIRVYSTFNFLELDNTTHANYLFYIFVPRLFELLGLCSAFLYLFIVRGGARCGHRRNSLFIPLVVTAHGMCHLVCSLS
jgi:hypothetical protein